MKRQNRHWSVALALLGVMTSTAVGAAPTSRDLALTANGQLQGQVYSGSGQTLPFAKVTLVRNGTRPSQPLTATADKDGKFQFAGVSPGLYDLGCNGRGGTVRVWRAEVAPPKAHDAAMIVVGDVTRGRLGGGGGFWSNPLWLTGLVVAAIAIPLALDDDSGS